MAAVDALDHDRAAGVLLATACGDALGAGYEFGPPLPASAEVTMRGGNGFAPGEWTDDTAMAVAVARATAAGPRPHTAAGLSAIAADFLRWYDSDPPDIGNQTRAVLGGVAARTGDLGAALAQRSAAFLAANPTRAAGNGGLMRTAAVALAYLDDPDTLVEAAGRVSALTHADPVSQEACALWCLAIRHAVLTGTFDGPRLGLARLPADRATYWSARLDEAEARPPRDFARNGWVVEALQGAWSAIVRTPVPPDDPGRGQFPAQHLRLALEAAVRGGRDTDTVAAIAGGLLGARWGASAVPAAWRRVIVGWPGYHARDLIRLGVHTARRGLGLPADDSHGWPGSDHVDYSYARTHVVAHPRDPGVLLTTVQSLHPLPAGIDAVVTLCRLGRAEVDLDPAHHIEVWLIDGDRSHNRNLEFVIDDAARAVLALRAEGRTVLLHCVEADNRTPVVAARYSMLIDGIAAAPALAEILPLLRRVEITPALRDGLLRLDPGGG